jgi:hypothetical protein
MVNRRIFAGGGLVAIVTALAEMGVVTAQSNGGQCAVCRSNDDCANIGCVGGVCAPQSTVCGGQAFDTSCRGLGRRSKFYACEGNTATCCSRKGTHCRRAKKLCG